MMLSVVVQVLEVLLSQVVLLRLVKGLSLVVQVFIQSVIKVRKNNGIKLKKVLIGIMVFLHTCKLTTITKAKPK